MNYKEALETVNKDYEKTGHVSPQWRVAAIVLTPKGISLESPLIPTKLWEEIWDETKSPMQCLNDKIKESSDFGLMNVGCVSQDLKLVTWANTPIKGFNPRGDFSFYAKIATELSGKCTEKGFELDSEVSAPKLLHFGICLGANEGALITKVHPTIPISFDAIEIFDRKLVNYVDSMTTEAMVKQQQQNLQVRILEAQDYLKELEELRVKFQQDMRIYSMLIKHLERIERVYAQLAKMQGTGDSNFEAGVMKHIVPVANLKSKFYSLMETAGRDEDTGLFSNIADEKAFVEDHVEPFSRKVEVTLPLAEAYLDQMRKQKLY